MFVKRPLVSAVGSESKMTNKILSLATLFATSTAIATPVEYNCEEKWFTNGVKAESWNVILDITLSPKKLRYISFDGGEKKITGFKNNRMAVAFFNDVMSHRKDDAPAIAAFQKDIGDDFATIQIYGTTYGVKAGDVIEIFWPEWEPYFCYRKGSAKDKLMKKMRDEFNLNLQ